MLAARRLMFQHGGIGPGVFVAGAGTGGSSSSASVSIPGSRAAGDLMIYAFTVFSLAADFTSGPAGWTLEGTSTTKMKVYSKISDGTEATVAAALSGSVGWAAEMQIYRGPNIRIVSSAFGPAASDSTHCTLPTASVTGEPLAVEIWGGCRTGGSPVGITTPAGPVNVTSGSTGGRAIAAGSQAMTGVATTPSDIATATLADDGWGAAVLTVAIDL